jgi:hypothetical protein
MITNRWKSNQGWDYFSQFYSAQPTLLITAQCVAKESYSPMTQRVNSKVDL